MISAKKVFLIDDDKVFNFINSKIMVKTLASIDVITYEFAQLALDDLKKIIDTNLDEFPEYIFLDINMPEMDGWEFLDEYMNLQESVIAKCKIIMLTSSIDPKDIEKSSTYPIVSDFISKPLTSEGLLKIFVD